MLLVTYAPNESSHNSLSCQPWKSRLLVFSCVKPNVNAMFGLACLEYSCWTSSSRWDCARLVVAWRWKSCFMASFSLCASWMCVTASWRSCWKRLHHILPTNAEITSGTAHACQFLKTCQTARTAVQQDLQPYSTCRFKPASSEALQKKHPESCTSRAINGQVNAVFVTSQHSIRSCNLSHSPIPYGWALFSIVPLVQIFNGLPVSLYACLKVPRNPKPADAVLVDSNGPPIGLYASSKLPSIPNPADAVLVEP